MIFRGLKRALAHQDLLSRKPETFRDMSKRGLLMSLICTPPKPKKPPSFDASATAWAICCSQALKEAAPAGAFASTKAAACLTTSRALVCPQPFARDGPAFCRLILARDGLHEFCGARIMGGAHDRPRARHALFESTPKPAGISRSNCDPCHHCAFEKRFPLLGVKLLLLAIGLAPRCCPTGANLYACNLQDYKNL
jgi:hypothetical protein